MNKKNGIYYGLKENLSFTKYSGCGNDFIIINNKDEKFNYNVKELCCRGKSIGADGLILIEKSLHYDFKWNYYNSDGNIVEMCGNGARCAAHFAYDNNICKKPNIKFINSFGIVSNASINKDNVKLNIDINPEFINISNEKNNHYGCNNKNRFI